MHVMNEWLFACYTWTDRLGNAPFLVNVESGQIFQWCMKKKSIKGNTNITVKVTIESRSQHKEIVLPKNEFCVFSWWLWLFCLDDVFLYDLYLQNKLRFLKSSLLLKRCRLRSDGRYQIYFWFCWSADIEETLVKQTMVMIYKTDYHSNIALPALLKVCLTVIQLFKKHMMSCNVRINIPAQSVGICWRCLLMAEPVNKCSNKPENTLISFNWP